MAYPAVTTPYGFRPVNSVDGKPYAGATRQLKIRNTKYGGMGGNADPIFYGDIVYLTQFPETGTGARVQRLDSSVVQRDCFPQTYGVFMGCTFTNPVTKQPTFSQFWPGSNAAPDAVAYIVDDPMALYKVVGVATVDSVDIVTPSEYWAIGMQVNVNLEFAGNDGSTYSGDSYMSVIPPGFEPDPGVAKVLVVDVVPETKTDTGYPELLVKLIDATLGSNCPVILYPPELLA